MEKEQVFKKPELLVVGYGIVGKHIADTFGWSDICDKKFEKNRENFYKDIPKKKYDACFVCVPTPMKDDGSCNINIVEEVVKQVNADVIVIKSTIPPRTTDYLENKYNKNIVFSPEYQGNTQHANIEYDFLIVGGKKENCKKVIELYKMVKTANLYTRQTNSVTAELCKYMENSFLATKVVFCNEFFRLANKLDVDYDELRECFCLDPRVNRSHTFVYEKYPYYDSKCFNKDLPAICKYSKDVLNLELKLISSVIKTNDYFKEEKNNGN